MKKTLHFSLLILLYISYNVNIISTVEYSCFEASSSYYPIEDETPTQYFVKPGDRLIYHHSQGYYEKWDILSTTPTSVNGTVSERPTLVSNWNPYIINGYLGWFDPISGRIACHYGLNVIPNPLNVSGFIEEIAGGYIVLWPATSANYTWDGSCLQIWSYTDPTYYAELNYNSLGILTLFNETYESGGETYVNTQALIEFYQYYGLTPNSPTTMEIQTTNTIKPALTVNSTAPVEFNLSSTTEAPAGVNLNDSLVFIEISVNDSSAIVFPVKLTFNYTDQLLLDLGITESNLKIYYLNISNQWEVIPATIDTDKNIIEAEISHFSIYALASSIDEDENDNIKSKKIAGYNNFMLLGISIVLVINIIKMRKIREIKK